MKDVDETGQRSAAPVRAVRAAAWVVLLTLAAAQAWVNRYAISPDGLSYLDLSDAVVTGEWSELLNPYWSPLYPALVGALRLVLRPDASWATATLHLASLLAFAASLRTFELLVDALATRGRGWSFAGARALDSIRGRAIAYALFGLLSLVMTPLSLTTPDVMVSAVVYAALAALLRLSNGPPRRSAMLLGTSLAFGVLAKTFMLPWSIVCFAVAVIGARRQPAALRAVALAGMGWLVVTGAWVLMLSRHEGRFTTGDTGKLTYAWYVNMNGSPTSVTMPPATRVAAIETAFPGVGVMPNARGTNPIWYDPARWYAGVEPVRDLAQQGRVFLFLAANLAASLAPLVFLVCLLVAVTDSGARWTGIRSTWPLVLPALLAIGAYSLILVATRYVVSFALALTLAAWLAFEWPRLLHPARIAAGLGAAMLLMWRSPDAPQVFGLEAGVLVATAIAAWPRQASALTRVVAAVVSGFATRLVLPPSLPTVPRVGIAVAAALLVLLTIRANQVEGEAWSARVRQWFAVSSGLLLLWVGGKKLSESFGLIGPSTGRGNVNWSIAQHLESSGLPHGARVLMVGSPFDAYWIRGVGGQISAVVPPQRATDFWALGDAGREALIARITEASGATAMIVTVVPTSIAADPAWKARYPGGVRVLR